MRNEGLVEVVLVKVDVELPVAVVTTRHDDVVTSTMWADLLFRLRLQVMRANGAEIDVVETICAEDAFAVRVRMLLTVYTTLGLRAASL